MRIYIAAPWRYRAAAHDVSKVVAAAGYRITSRWLTGHEDTTDPDRLAEEADHDFKDVMFADVLLLLNYEMSEGKAVEQGIALAEGLPIVAVGRPSNVFHHLPRYIWVDSVDDAILVLSRLDA